MGVSHGKDYAPLQHAWFDSSWRITSLCHYRLGSTAVKCSFVPAVELWGAFSQWIPIDFFARVIKLYVARFVTTVFSSAPRGSSPINFLFYLDGVKLNKTQTEWALKLEQGNGSKHGVRTWGVQHLFRVNLWRVWMSNLRRLFSSGLMEQFKSLKSAS